MFDRKYKSTKSLGHAALWSAMALFAAVGYTVLLPTTDSQDFDIALVTHDGFIQRVQVRCTRRKTSSGKYRVNVSLSGGGKLLKTAQQLAYDALAVVTTEGDVYLIPKNVITVKETLTLGEWVGQYKVGRVDIQHLAFPAQCESANTLTLSA